jgi:hypothetical protein
LTNFSSKYSIIPSIFNSAPTFWMTYISSLCSVSPLNTLIPMNSAIVPSQTATAPQRPDIDRLIAGLRHRSRWKMLKELCAGEPRTIAELAKVAGCSYDNASKHLFQLFRAGLVARGRGRVYEMPKQYLPTPGQPVVDYGHCLLRLDQAG